MEIINLLNKCKTVAKIESDYELARLLKVERRLMNYYTRGERKPDFYTCLRIADYLKMDCFLVLLIAEIETERNEQKLKYYNELVRLCASTMLEHQQKKIQPREV